MSVLLRELDEAKRARRFHKVSGPRLGNVEAMIAGLKVHWLVGLIREIDPASTVTTKD